MLRGQTDTKDESKNLNAVIENIVLCLW